MISGVCAFILIIALYILWATKDTAAVIISVWLILATATIIVCEKIQPLLQSNQPTIITHE